MSHGGIRIPACPCLGIAGVLAFAWLLQAEALLESNVVYGMYSGLALLMDVHYPEKPSGYGVIFIAGSGWHAPLAYSAAPLKESVQVKLYVKPLAAAGYVVFAVSHRAAPRFRYPAAVEDVQRAVRFIRHNAGKYGIDPSRIGGVGGSSGGHLVSMLGTLDGKGDPEDSDPVNLKSAKLQCVVARAAPADFMGMNRGSGSPATASFLGMTLLPREAKESAEYRTYREAPESRRRYPSRHGRASGACVVSVVVPEVVVVFVHRCPT